MRLEIAYWTRFYEPRWEAVSREVQALRDHFEGSRIYNASQEVALRSSSKRLDYHHRFYELQAPLLLSARRFRAIHAFSGSWRPIALMAPMLRVPLVLTVTEAFPEISASTVNNLRRFTRVVSESQAYLEELADAGLDAERARCILPGVDLARFGHEPPADGPFTIVFASAPFETAHLESRGVRLLVEALAEVDGVSLKVLWRGREREALDRLLAGSGVDAAVTDGVVEHAGDIYADAHATVVPFVGRQRNKLCPHSLMESLAAGKPVLLTEDVAVGDLVRDEACGVVASPTVEGLRDGISSLREDYARLQANARPAAERHFDLQRFLRDYETLYQEVVRE